MASAAVAAPANIKSKRETSQPMVHSFEDVPHSADLTWVPCYDDKWCANLVVPLDYAKPEVGTTWIAFIKSEGANSTGQDVLYNPGGPNGSGVLSILAGLAEEFHGMTEGLYNFVSFDPRGVNASGIDPTCFPGDPETRTATFSKPNPEDPYELFYTSVAMGQYCSQAAKDTELKYVSTAAVVQDMMHFTELQAALDGHENPKESEIWYWGTSYGTIVAQTLAAMYPDRIGRVVSDANVNGEEWYNGMTKMAIKDTDKAFDYFFESCYNAGPEKCQFAGESKSAEEIKDRIYTIIEGLEKKPLISLDGGPGLITKKLVVSAIFQALYGPVGSFEIMDLAFVALEAGNATQVLQVLSARASRVRGPGPFNYDQIKQAETQMAVTRLDANGRFPYVSVEDYVKDIEEYKKASPLFGENFAAGNPLLAAGFSLSPPESQIFPGQYPAQHAIEITLMIP